MTKTCWAALAAVLCLFSVPAWCGTLEQGQAEEERLLGSRDQYTQHQNLLPFKRRLSASGTVEGSFSASAETAGLPAVATLEVARAFASAIDVDDDVTDGDSFAVSYEQEYTVEGTPIGVPKVMWAELRTAELGSFSVHRFRASRSGKDVLWLSNGERAGASALRWPVDEINISSGFGLRTNPIPIGRAVAARTARKGRKAGAGGPVRMIDKRKLGLTMHHGVDFAAETGTPIHAAAAGTVTGARPNGGYGNWIEIEHEGELQTIYGHLSAFAAGIDEGVWVEQGQLIGFVGSTGRSTGPHLHFELRKNGTPTNPVIDPAIRPPQLRGGDLERFRRLVTRNLDAARRGTETN